MAEQNIRQCFLFGGWPVADSMKTWELVKFLQMPNCVVCKVGICNKAATLKVPLDTDWGNTNGQLVGISKKLVIVTYKLTFVDKIGARDRSRERKKSPEGISEKVDALEHGNIL